MEEKSKKNGCLKWGLIVFGAFFALGLIGSIFNDEKKDGNTDQGTNGNTTITSTEISAMQNGETWKIKTSIDEMTDTKNIWATIRSKNYIEQEFPYNGETYATITIRYMQKYGENVLISIDKGQIVGNEFNNTNYITARFNNETPKKFYFDEASDGSTELVFIRNSEIFIEKCKTAKDIKIDIPIFQGGRPIFTFHIDQPLEWPQ